MAPLKKPVALKRKVETAVAISKSPKKRLKPNKSKPKKFKPELSEPEPSELEKSTLEKSKSSSKNSKPKKSKSNFKNSKPATSSQESPQEMSKVSKPTATEQQYEIKPPLLVDVIRTELYPEAKESTSYDAMSAMLKECMLGQRWEEAGRLLNAMCLYQFPDTDCQWKCGADVMRNHPNGNMEFTETLSSVVGKVNLNNQHKKQLEHALYLLTQNKIEEAHQAITRKVPYSPGGRTVHAMYLEKHWKDMCLAYTGLFKYSMWLQKHGSSGKQEEEELTGDGSTSGKLAAGAVDTSNLSRITSKPGVWDVFISTQIEILEHQDKIPEAEAALMKYCEDNPGNPNSHVYLYKFLKRHHPTSVDRILQVLKTLIGILPSEKYVLEYVSLLDSSYSSAAVQALPALFNILDYWYSSALPWKTLVKFVKSTLKHGDKESLQALQSCWELRKSWWPSYHFDRLQAAQMVKQDHGLMINKAILASVILGRNCLFVEKVRKSLKKKHSKALKRLNETISQMETYLFNQEAKNQLIVFTLFCAKSKLGKK